MKARRFRRAAEWAREAARRRNRAELITRDRGGQTDIVEPAIFRSLWRHRLLVVLFIGAFALLGTYVSSLRSSSYAAEAGAQLEDPRPAALSDSRSTKDQARYVADQTAILKSIAVSARASEIARTAPTPRNVDPQELQRKTSVISSDLSNYVLVRVRAGDPGTARVLADAVVQGYEQLTRSTFSAETRASIKRLDDTIPAVERQVALQPSADSVALLNELRTRRRALLVDVALTGDGVTVFTPAEPGKAQGVSRAAVLAISMVLGVLLAGGLAYALDARRQSFSSRFEPQPVLEAPALAEIPDFGREGLRSKLPVLEAPESRSAEAFRFLAFGIGLPAASSNGRTETGLASAGPLTVAFVAADRGTGTTTLASNCALAAAQEGRNVLVIDCEPGGNGPGQLLMQHGIEAPGSPEPSSGSETPRPDEPRQVLETSLGGSLSLLGAGAAHIDSVSASRLEHLVAGFGADRGRFDLVVIDVPPILHVAFAGALLRSADAAVVVVPHASEVGRLRHVRHRLDLLGIRPIGYVYNHGPSARGVSPWRLFSLLAARREPTKPSSPNGAASLPQAGLTADSTAGQPRTATGSTRLNSGEWE